MKKPLIAVVVFALAAVAVAGVVFAYQSGREPPPPTVSLSDKSADPAARERAVLAAGRSGDPESKAELRKLLAPAEPAGVRANAVTALADLKDWDSMPRFLDLLDDPSPAVRSRAGQAVAKLTGWQYPYDPSAPADKRAAAVARMRKEYQAMGRQAPPPLRN